jgi:molecular chaperone GrpE
MADAMRAVEARERESQAREGAEPEDFEGEDTLSESSGTTTKSAADAVTESLIKAKKELEEALEQTKNEAKRFHDNWLRAAADLENYRKRAQKEREEVEKFGNEKLLRSFLPVVDDLDRVIQSATQVGDDPKAKALIEGVKLVQKKFLDQLERNGASTFEAEGKAFDPNTHEAVQQIASDKPIGTVVNQLQRGFTLGGRLLRPALVTVSLGTQKRQDGSTEKE